MEFAVWCHFFVLKSAKFFTYVKTKKELRFESSMKLLLFEDSFKKKPCMQFLLNIYAISATKETFSCSCKLNYSERDVQMPI